MFKKILVPLDGSAIAECVLPHVVAWTRATHARIILLRVIEQSIAPDQIQPVDPIDSRLRHTEAEIYLEGIQDRLREAEPSGSIETVRLEGQAAERIVEYAHENGVDLIILSSHGRSGLTGWNISSVAQKITARVGISLLIVRAFQAYDQSWRTLRYRRILVPLDGSQRAECVMPLVYHLAQDDEAELMLVHVAARPDMPHRVPLTPEEAELLNNLVERNRAEMTKYLKQLKAHLPDNVQTRVVIHDNVITTLHRLVEEELADLVLISAHGYSGERTLPYGSVGGGFISCGAAPLLIVQDLSQEDIEPSLAKQVTQNDENGRRRLAYADKPFP